MDIEVWNNSLKWPKENTAVLETFTSESYQTCKEEIIGGNISQFILLDKVLALKPGKNNAKKENYRSISLRNIDAKIVNQILPNSINNLREK